MVEFLSRLGNWFMLFIWYRGGEPLANAAILIARKNGSFSTQKGYYSDLYKYEDAWVRLTVQATFNLVAYRSAYLVMVEVPGEVAGNWEIVFEADYFASKVLMFWYGDWCAHLMKLAKPIRRQIKKEGGHTTW